MILSDGYEGLTSDYLKNGSQLLTRYIALLKELRTAGVGCHVNGMFTGAFIYADDITLKAPSRESICHML